MNDKIGEFIETVGFLLVIAGAIAVMFYGGYYLVTQMMWRLPI